MRCINGIAVCANNRRRVPKSQATPIYIYCIYIILYYKLDVNSALRIADHSLNSIQRPADAKVFLSLLKNNMREMTISSVTRLRVLTATANEIYS
jgi:hypothetical protein